MALERLTVAVLGNLFFFPGPSLSWNGSYDSVQVLSSFGAAQSHMIGSSHWQLSCPRMASVNDSQFHLSDSVASSSSSSLHPQPSGFLFIYYYLVLLLLPVSMIGCILISWTDDLRSLFLMFSPFLSHWPHSSSSSRRFIQNVVH